MDGLRRAAFVLVLCGLTVIYASSRVFTPPLVRPAEIDEGHVGDTVRVNVTVEDVRSGDGAQFMRLAGDEGEIRAVAFEPLDVEDGGRYLVRGEVSLYHGDLEIIVESAVPPGSSGNREGVPGGRSRAFTAAFIDRIAGEVDGELLP